MPTPSQMARCDWWLQFLAKNSGPPQTSECDPIQINQPAYMSKRRQVPGDVHFHMVTDTA